jgi:hypothetical protein
MGSSLMLLQHNGDHGEASPCRTVTRDETWVFHDIPENKVKSMSWIHLHSPAKKKFTTVQSPEKVTATVFCNVYRVLLVDFIPHGPTINAAAYQDALKKLWGGYMAKQTRMLITGVLLLHDNGQPHRTDATINFLKFCCWKNSSTSTTQIQFPLLDFHLPPKMKHHTRGQCFHFNGYVQNEVKKLLHAQDMLLL